MICSRKFALFGCWGVDCEEDSPQRAIANDINNDPEIDFMVTAGDNFYNDIDLDKNLINCYSKRMYAVLGNHDIENAETQMAIVDKNWVMPARNYIIRITTKNGTPRLRIIMINTNPIYSKKYYNNLPGVLDRDTRELKEFLDEIPRSDLPTIVVGHHPIITNRHEDRGRVKRYLSQIEKQIVQIANIYVCADEHNLQHIMLNDLNEFILGGGGAKPDSTIMMDFPDHTKFKHPYHGYGIFDVSELTMTIKPMNPDMSFDNVYQYQL